MLEPETLNEIWDEAVRKRKVDKKPKVLYAIYDDQWFYVLDDSRSITFLLTVDKVGKRGIGKGVNKAFAVPTNRCMLDKTGDYYIVENGHIRVVGCQKPFGPYRHEQQIITSKLPY